MTPVFEQLFEEKKISHNVFSFHLSNQDGVDGHLRVGYVDKDEYDGELHYVPLSKKGYWQITMDGVDLKKDPKTYTDNCDKTPIVGKNEAIVDSGTTYVLVPKEVHDAIVQQMPSCLTSGGYSQKDIQEFYNGTRAFAPTMFVNDDCVLPTITISFPQWERSDTHEIDVVLSPEQYLRASGQFVNFGIQAIPSNGRGTILGLPFMV